MGVCGWWEGFGVWGVMVGGFWGVGCAIFVWGVGVGGDPYEKKDWIPVKKSLDPYEKKIGSL